MTYFDQLNIQLSNGFFIKHKKKFQNFTKQKGE